MRSCFGQTTLNKLKFIETTLLQETDGATQPQQTEQRRKHVSVTVTPLAVRASRAHLTWTKVVFPEPAIPSTMRHTGLSRAAATGAPPSAAAAEVSRFSGEAAAAAAILLAARTTTAVNRSVVS